MTIGWCIFGTIFPKCCKSSCPGVSGRRVLNYYSGGSIGCNPSLQRRPYRRSSSSSRSSHAQQHRPAATSRRPRSTTLPYWPGAPRNLNWWKQLNSCPSGSPTITSYGSYSIHLHTGCADGSQAALVDISAAGHYCFASFPPHVNTTQLAWNFVQQFSMPLPPVPSSPSLSPPSLGRPMSPPSGGEGAPVPLIACLVGVGAALALLDLVVLNLVVSRWRRSTR